MDERIVHALDLAAVGEWNEARRAVEGVADPIAVRLLTFFDELRRRDGEQDRMPSSIRHELGNLLTVAQGNVEAMIDGIVEPAPQRLDSVRTALAKAGELIGNLTPSHPVEERREAFDFSELVRARVDELRPVAKTKNVAFDYDASALSISGPAMTLGIRSDVDRAITAALLNALRYTPPGGAVRIAGWRAGELLLALRGSVSAKLLDAVGPDARIVHEENDGATLCISLAFGRAETP